MRLLVVAFCVCGSGLLALECAADGLAEARNEKDARKMLETVRCVLLPLLAKCKRRKAGFVRLFRRMQWGGAWQLVCGLSACVRPFRLCGAASPVI